MSYRERAQCLSLKRMTIRHATLNDLPAIVEIYNSTIPSRIVTADTEPVTVDSRKNWFHSHSPEKRPLMVIETDNEIAGWLSFHSFYGRPAYDITAEIGIYIHEKHRNKKLGKTLLEKAIELSPSLKIENLLGFIFAHNEPSLKLFAQYGFEKWAYLPGVAVIEEKKIDLVILGRKISQ